MIDFGYKILNDRQIDFDSNDRIILDFVSKCEPSIDWCMSCGTCASACTAAMSDDYSLRKLILYARRGMNNEISGMVFRCRFCGKCLNACPRGVNTRNIIYLMQRAVKNYLSHEI
jgi:heterodisulfide reductase subunit C